MTCPTCHAKTKTIDSRATKPGRQRRRHLCLNGHKFSTLETVEKFIEQHICSVTGLRRYKLGTVVVKGGDPFKCEHCQAWHLTPQEKPATPTEPA